MVESENSRRGKTAELIWLEDGYLLFLGFHSSGNPCLAKKARALSTFLITDGDLLKSGILLFTVIPGKCF